MGTFIIFGSPTTTSFLFFFKCLLQCAFSCLGLYSLAYASEYLISWLDAPHMLNPSWIRWVLSQFHASDKGCVSLNRTHHTHCVIKIVLGEGQVCKPPLRFFSKSLTNQHIEGLTRLLLQTIILLEACHFKVHMTSW